MILTEDYTRIAATWSRVRMILLGLDDDVDTFGVMTAWNPQSMDIKDVTPEMNKENTAKLLEEIHELGNNKDMVKGPIKVEGNFWKIPEGSFLIPNISRDDMIKLCKKYDQWGVVYGERVNGKGGGGGFRYELLGPDGEARSRPKTEILFSGNRDSEGNFIDDLRTDYSAFGGDPGNKQKEIRPGETAPVRKRFKVPFDKKLPD